MRGERVKVGESHSLAREKEGGDQSGSMDRKGWTPQ